MLDFFEWSSRTPRQKPYLILGKGPTYSKIEETVTADYHIIGLNHVSASLSVDFAHAIDLDVLHDVGAERLNQSKFVLTPYYPHIEHTASRLNVEQLAESGDELLAGLITSERLVCYNASTAINVVGETPVVEARFFSADTVVNLLCQAGERRIWSIGVDGGNDYSESFSGLRDKTLLANGRGTFSTQFLAIGETLKKYDAELNPVGEEPINIFVGSTRDQDIACRVLEYSIRRRTSACVKFMPLFDADIDIPIPKDVENRARTPFSFQRFLIPELCDYKGKAVYLDSDMQVLTDIRDLAFRDLEGQQLANCWEGSGSSRRPQFSVMLMDCMQLKHWDIREIVGMLDRGDITYERLMFEMELADHKGQSLEPEWNSLEYFELDRTKLIHYTDMNTQPWLSLKNRNSEVWLSELFSAIQDDYISKSTLRKEVRLGNIRPSILYQVGGEELRLSVPKFVRLLDKLFTPPHKQRNKWKYKLLLKIRRPLAYIAAKLYDKL